MQRWTTEYKGNKITVENQLYSEKLIVNEELQDELIGVTERSRLWGHLPSGEVIKVSVGGDHYKIHCRIFIDDKLVFSDSI